MPELIILAFLYVKQVKQIRSGQSRLPDLTRSDKNFQFGSDQLPDPTRPMRSSTPITTKRKCPKNRVFGVEPCSHIQ
jgi:hypothetical protein